ncbi:HAD family hydrolase [Spirulina subsalsa]|uniref:HAD family hydrolase n=1 Tax=Spirulina subsalsa TaxID=54311 RepID=UPI0002E68D20|nr:HAD family hydrolase [Spirulina subsalsa]
MAAWQGFIFDVDGTLAETEREGHRVAFNQAFRAAGLDWDWSVEFYGQLLSVAGGKERIRHYLEQFRPEEERSEEFIRQLHGQKTEYYRQLLTQGAIPLRPGVERLLGEAQQQGIRLAIATTSAYENAIALLEQHLNPQIFEVIAAGDIVAAKKPAPDIYHYVRQKMELSPQQCLVFEDSEQGLKAATQAGFSTLVTVNDYTQHHDLTGAWLVVNHLGEPEHPLTVLQGHWPAPYINVETLLQISAKG